jgi:hypothetical protein
MAGWDIQWDPVLWIVAQRVRELEISGPHSARGCSRPASLRSLPREPRRQAGMVLFRKVFEDQANGLEQKQSP